MVMAGGWKLHVDGRQNKRWLYNLTVDPTERTNLIDRSPEVANRLQALLDEHNKELGPRDFPVLIEGVIAIDRTIADPHVPGEEFAYWPN